MACEVVPHNREEVDLEHMSWTSTIQVNRLLVGDTPLFNVRKFASRISLSISSLTPLAQGYPSTDPLTKFTRCMNNSPPHPFGVGWGGELFILKKAAWPRVYILVRHYTPPVASQLKRECSGTLVRWDTCNTPLSWDNGLWRNGSSTGKRLTWDTRPWRRGSITEKRLFWDICIRHQRWWRKSITS